MKDHRITDADYKAALREAAAHFDNEPEPGTVDADRLKTLLALIEAYEAKQADTATAVADMLRYMQTRKPESETDLKALINEGRA